jgi:hypothetical protein
MRSFDWVKTRVKTRLFIFSEVVFFLKFDIIVR